MTDPPNIIWITLDSVRGDHTSMGGYRRETTPHIQRIADSPDGHWSANCFAHSNTTRVSTASTITGTYPSHHGVWGNRTIPAELDTVPELLADIGYHTVGLSRNANSSMGFNRGFDEFQWISADTFLDAVDWRTTAKYVFNVRRHSAGFDTDTAKHATPFIINDMAKRRLRSFEGSREPFFMYLHYNEPHRPYYPPLPYLDRYTDDIAMSTERAASVAMEMHDNADEIIANGISFSDEEWEALYAMYDAEIAYTDECVGRLFEFIQSLDLGNTVVVVTADHGELFGEKGLLTHKLVLHDSLINVPLVVHGPIDIASGSEDLIQHADLMQTLVEMAGGDTEQFQGVDIREETREYVISQACEQEPILEEFLEINPDFDASRYHRQLLTCLRDERFKYQESGARSELFELPDEDRNVIEDYSERGEKMAETLAEWFDTDGRPVSTDQRAEEFSDAMKAQLSDLGYLVE